MIGRPALNGKHWIDPFNSAVVEEAAKTMFEQNWRGEDWSKLSAGTQQSWRLAASQMLLDLLEISPQPTRPSRKKPECVGGAA